MTQIIVTLIVAILGSNGLATVITILINRHYQKQDEIDDDLKKVRKAVEALAHDSYFRHCRYLMSKNDEDHEITEGDLENHNYLYSAYHNLGLNGVGDKMHAQVLDMKVRTAKPEWISVKR